ncbi:helix-turn-helix domain-containing protein [Pseudonocardia alaniniphila]|uniref:Helix-turn-helix domain-containing protein n=1 Tax=Pseudonocardia alaniniphila TaxID=75291 RepID=A0ABS9TUA3_9PSEU|nr:helix-turn-helix domain-containing protein [Pseudonocardia alaniniphila]MCH6171923.1 helix-turn-helix domain-containing protein [Pseudonocardia alaniniphila]
MQIYEYSGEEYEHIAGEFSIPLIARTGPDFRGRSAVQKLGGALTLYRSHFRGPISAVRTNRMAARASADNGMLFCLQEMVCHGYMRQRGRSAELVAGTGILIEARSPSERTSQSEARLLTLHFSRELLPLRTTEITDACARSADSAAPATRMLSGYLGRLLDLADDLTASQRLDAGRAAIELLTMVLRNVAPSVPGGDGPEDVLLDMMRTHVREHLADPELRVEELARRHHVSVRHAYRLFTRVGTTPAAYLREQRLLAAQAMLSDPRHARLRLSHIAAAVGFLDIRTFERAFRRQYGMTPCGWRREHCPSRAAPRT